MGAARSVGAQEHGRADAVSMFQYQAELNTSEQSTLSMLLSVYHCPDGSEHVGEYFFFSLYPELQVTGQ